MSDCVICKDGFGSTLSPTDLETIQPQYINFAERSLKVATTKCGHLFHFSCISNWLTTKVTNCKCPICNKKITRGTITMIYYDWTGAATNKDPAFSANKIEILENEKTHLSQKLFQSKMELDKLRKDMHDLRKNLKTKLNEKTHLVNNLQKEIERLKALPTNSTPLKRKNHEDNVNSHKFKRTSTEENSRRRPFSINQLSDLTIGDPEPGLVTSYNDILPYTWTTGNIHPSLSEDYQTSFPHYYFDEYINRHESPEFPLIRPTRTRYPNDSGVVDLRYSSSVSPILNGDDRGDSSVCDLTLD